MDLFNLKAEEYGFYVLEGGKRTFKEKIESHFQKNPWLTKSQKINFIKNADWVPMQLRNAKKLANKIKAKEKYRKMSFVFERVLLLRNREYKLEVYNLDSHKIIIQNFEGLIKEKESEIEELIPEYKIKKLFNLEQARRDLAIEFHNTYMEYVGDEEVGKSFEKFYEELVETLL